MLNRDAGGRMTLAMQKQLPGGPFRDLTGRVSQLRIIDLERGTDTLQWQTDALIEAPNWAPDGSALWLNGRGAILRWRFGGGAPPEPINIGRIEDANNDHCIAPDGRSLYLSAGGAVYAVSADGGEPLQVTPEGRVQFYLHGVSPDGRWLACATIDMGSDAGRWGVAVLPAAGGAPRPLLLSSQPLDGPEWSPDGDWIWFNGELQADAPGHSQIFRMRTDGSGVERMTRGPGVDWFPHPSPDGRHVAFLRYPSGTTGHPPDRLVEIWLMTAAGTAVTRLAAFRGGQGSFNVNGWSPDGGRIAYVAYPLAASADDDGGGEIPQRPAD